MVVILIDNRVIGIIAHQAGVDSDHVTNELSLNDLGICSIEQRTALIMDLEDEFAVTLPDETVEGTHTVKQITDCVNSLL